MRWFPSGLAEGTAFCNRVQERERLKLQIENTRHTVLIGPRRYGKSSLATQVMHENRYLHVWVDFLSVTTKQEVADKIKQAVKDLLLLLAPELKKLKINTLETIKAMSPELNLNAMGQSLTLSLYSDDSTEIDDMLVELDKYAQKVNKTAVLVFDEFQQVSQVKDSQALEALIRHAIERSKSITYVFSGSNRHILQEMFGHSDRPLYRLCTHIQLNRIDAVSYIPFIMDAAETRWGQAVQPDVIEKILQLTERHPFYVNILCGELWMRDVPPETSSIVEQEWRSYILRHKSIIISDVVPLPLNQKKVIKTLSLEVISEPYSNHFSNLLKISVPSIRRALEVLLLKDIVFEDEDGVFKVLDPALSYYFKYIY